MRHVHTAQSPAGRTLTEPEQEIAPPRPDIHHVERVREAERRVHLVCQRPHRLVKQGHRNVCAEVIGGVLTPEEAGLAVQRLVPGVTPGPHACEHARRD